MHELPEQSAGLPEGACAIKAGGQPLWLLPNRAAFLPGSATLLVADTHFGKSATFRARGIPVPAGTDGDDLDRLSRLLRSLRARRLIVLGDFVHAKAAFASGAMDAVAGWRARFADVEFVVVAGNHDRHAGRLDAVIRYVEEPWPLDGLWLAHDPATPAPGFKLCGHVHPGVVLAAGRERLRLPCFAFTAELGLLPAFGGFTGLVDIDAAAYRAYAVTPDRVLAVPRADPAEVRKTLLGMLAARAPNASVCPSEIARALSPEHWRTLMPAVRDAAYRLAAQGLVEITQGGKPASGHGPIRVRLLAPPRTPPE